MNIDKAVNDVVTVIVNANKMGMTSNDVRLELNRIIDNYADNKNPTTREGK